MSVKVAVSIDGVNVGTGQIAAFVGSQQRGHSSSVVSVPFGANRGKKYFSFQVWADGAGESVSFEYAAAGSSSYSVLSPEVTFEVDGIFGTVASPQTLAGTAPAGGGGGGGGGGGSPPPPAPPGSVPEPCSDGCVAEFAVCATEGPGYAKCWEEIANSHGRIASFCKPRCVETANMLTYKVYVAPSPPPFPPPAPPGTCTSDCENEFGVCCTEGPGYTVCVDELTNGRGPLGGICTKGCTLTTTMRAHDHGKCLSACEREFTLCVTEGPGFDACKSELDGNNPDSRLTAACANGCTPTAAMMGLQSSSKSACTAACANEFANCVNHGPGYADCVTELREGKAPLGDVCDQQCQFTGSMTALASNPADGSCTNACAEEFLNCVEFKTNSPPANGDSACASCTKEINDVPQPNTPLKEVGCVPSCGFTAKMTNKCS